MSWAGDADYENDDDRKEYSNKMYYAIIFKRLLFGSFAIIFVKNRFLFYKIFRVSGHNGLHCLPNKDKTFEHIFSINQKLNNFYK